MGIEIKKYFTTNTGREIHMTGSYVGVCWNLKEVEEIKTDESGNRIKIITSQRMREPYVDFPWIDDDGYERDDSTINGALRIEQAEEVLEELRWACNYIRMME